jgi:prevent-host-death family protein
MATAPKDWPIAEAKAKLSELVDEAVRQGPQVITRHGKREVAVVKFDVFDRLARPRQSLADAFLNSPLRGSDVKIERLRGKVRPVKF